MLSRFAVAALVSTFAVTAWAQSTPAPPAHVPSAHVPPAPAKAVTKKPAAKAKPATAPAVAAERGPCSLGVISAIGDRFSVQKFGITILENEKTFVPIENWGLDDLVLARVRAATAGDPTVRRIAYPKGAFEPYLNPKSALFRDPHERLPAIVQSLTANAHCERYLVIIRTRVELSGTHMEVDGIGAYNQGLGSLLRHSHLFAAFSVIVLDGRTYENINRAFAGIGARLSQGLRLTEDPLNRLDNAQFPDPPSSATGSAILRERTRELIAARLDEMLPDYLKRD